MALLIVFPAMLSLLILAAHILHHGGSLIWVALPIALCGLLFSRKWWILYIVQTVLVISAIDWLFTAYDLMQQRQQAGQDWLRAAAILVGVALLNLAAAVLLRCRKAA